MVFNLRAEDLPFEEDVLRFPGLLRNWTRYLQHQMSTSASPDMIVVVFERALTSIPFSYKLWKMYIDWAESHHHEWPALSSLFERSVRELPRFPRLWLRYAAACCRMRHRDLALGVLDRALRCLPITQHERLWDFYRTHGSEMLLALGDQNCIVSLWQRWLQLHPDRRNVEYAERMIAFGCYGEAASVLWDCVGIDGNALSRLLELLADHPKVDTVNVDQVIRGVISHNPGRSGAYWNILAARAIRRGEIHTAMAMFEEALASIVSVEDYLIVFETFSLFLESLATAAINGNGQRASFALARFERLLQSRRLLMSNVLLRAQPSNVSFWMDRFNLFSGAPLVNEFERAIRSINPKHTDRFHRIWLAFARLYIDTDGDWATARQLLAHAASAKVRLLPEDHAQLLIGWAELELPVDRHVALQVLTHGTHDDGGDGDAKNNSNKNNAPSHRTLTLWQYYVDLLEAMYYADPSSDDTSTDLVIGAYQKIVNLKIATPQTFIDYAAFVLQTIGDADRAFAVYERGIAAFGWPIADQIWSVYLPRALEFLPKQPLGVERMRDLFEQALRTCPDQFAPSYVLLYCQLEERYGLIRNALRILDVAVKRPLLPSEDRVTLYSSFIRISRSAGDIQALRVVYERAIKALADVDQEESLIAMSTEWAQLEATLGELTRARSLFVHAANQASEGSGLWSAWEAMERTHGDQGSYRDMLRLKRAILDRQAKRHGDLMTSFVPAAASSSNKVE